MLRRDGVIEFVGERSELDAKVAFLKRPEVYPERPVNVEAVETHMSWVFLTHCHVYKLKKPVRSPYLDFSTVETRREDGEREVALNQRLAPDVYLGLVPLTQDGGRMRLGGRGEVLDWMVHMRRLPAERALDRLIEHGSVRHEDFRRLGSALAAFYRSASPVELTPARYRKNLEGEVEENRRELSDSRLGLPRDLVETIAEAQREVLQTRAGIFDERVFHHRIVDAHGDLRPEHVYLDPEPVIIDCLEFNRDLRILDCAADLSFLALECERLGSADGGRIILETYSEITADRPPAELLAFYRSHHATFRAKIAVWHLRDEDVRESARWSRKANRYLRMATAIEAVLGGR